MPGPNPNPTDFALHTRWIVPVVPRGTVLEDHALIVRDGCIDALLPAAVAREQAAGLPWLERPDHVLMPGLVNAHGHAAMTLFRGLADDLPLQRWLEDHVWPAEARWVNPDFVRDGTELAVAEMLAGGTTCFNDMYFFPDIVGEVALEQGMRAVVGMIVIEVPTAWARTTEEYFDKGLAVHDRFIGSELISTAFAPHAPYTVSDDSFRRIAKLANELETPVHTHLHETSAEVAAARQAEGRRPFDRLADLGLLTPLLGAVHMTDITDAEIAGLAAAGASVIHCPESNLKLASGFCPVARLLAGGVNVALGTDGAGSNNDLDMFGEMRTAALLAKGAAGDASVVDAARALEMATLGGARAMGLADRIGSLEPGKQADLVCVDLSGPANQPVHHPISQLVYSVCRGDVSDVWVAGRQRVAQGRLDRDLPELFERTRAWQARIAAAAAGQ